MLATNTMLLPGRDIGMWPCLPAYVECSRKMFYYLNVPFCEGMYGRSGITWVYNGYTGITEVVSCVSNLVYVVWALWCLNQLRGPDSLLRLSCAYLLALGIASALYHGTMWNGFGILDGMAMVLLVIGLAMACQEHLLFVCVQPDRLLFRMLSGCLYGGLTLLLMGAIDDKTLSLQIGDKVWLGVPLGCIVLACASWIILQQSRTGRVLLPAAQLRTSYRVLAVSGGFGLLAFSMHLVDSYACNAKTTYMFPHALWHVFTACSIGYFMVWLTAMRCPMFQKTGTLQWRYWCLPTIMSAAGEDGIPLLPRKKTPV